MNTVIFILAFLLVCNALPDKKRAAVLSQDETEPDATQLLDEIENKLASRLLKSQQNDDYEHLKILALMQGEEEENDNPGAGQKDADALADKVYEILQKEQMKSRATLQAFNKELEKLIQQYPLNPAMVQGWWKRTWRRVKHYGRHVLRFVG